MSVSTIDSPPYPTLPSELIEQVVGQIRKESTLVACSQASRTFEHYSFRQLFRNVRLCCDQWAIGTFARLMPRSHRIFRHVKELRIGCSMVPGCFHSSTRQVPESRYQQLSQILELFSEHSGDRLEGITLRRISWGYLPGYLQAALTALLGCPSLKTLQFEYVEGFPLGAFRQVSSGLKTFQTTNSDCNLNPMGDALPDDSSACAIPAGRPEHLIISSKGLGTGGLESNLVDCVPNSLDISHLVSLCMVVRFDSEWKLLQRLMESASSTLESLSVVLQSVHPYLLSASTRDQTQLQDAYKLGFDFASFQLLQSIDFWVPLRFRTIDPILRGLSEALRGLPSSGSALKRITFFSYLETTPFELTDAEWYELDLKLAQTTSLEYIKFYFARFMNQTREEQLVLYERIRCLLREKLPMSFQNTIVTERTTDSLTWPLK